MTERLSDAEKSGIAVYCPACGDTFNAEKFDAYPAGEHLFTCPQCDTEWRVTIRFEEAMWA